MECPVSQDIKNITLIFAGENHYDPGPTGMIRDGLQQLHEKAIPQIFCREITHEMTLEMKISAEIEAATEGKTLLKNTKVLQFAKTSNNLAYPYFTHDSTQCIKKLLGKAADYVLLNLNIKEQNLLNTQLIKYNIPYQGIERSNKEYMELCHLVAIGIDPEQIYLQHEAARVQAMLENLFNKAVPHLASTGGVVWISIGGAHTHNLAISALHHIKQNKLSETHSFNVISLVCNSEYAPNEDFSDAIKQMRKGLQRPDLEELFNKQPYKKIDDIQEQGKHKFTSTKFQEVVNFSIKAFQRTHLFSLPPLTSEMRNVLQETKAKIVKKDMEHTLISIVSEVLLQPLRNSLGIDRRIITLRKNGNEILESMSKNPLLTIEPQIDPLKFLITFPQSETANIEALIKG